MKGLVLLLFSLLLAHKENMVNQAYGKSDQDQQKDFFKTCPPSACGIGGPEIRFPYRLSPQPSNCGMPGMELTCSGNDTILNHPNAGPSKVKHIDYVHGEITVELGDTVSLCPVQNLSSLNLTTTLYQPYGRTTMDLVHCSKDKINQPGSVLIETYGPIPCLSNSNQLNYLVDQTNTSISNLNAFCTVVYNNITIPMSDDSELNNGRDALVQGIQVHLNVTLSWSGAEECKTCEAAGKQCSGTKSFCTYHRTNVKVIGAASAMGLVVLLSVASILYYIYRNSDDFSKHEELLAKYNKRLTRYSFLEIKKMTNRFKDKLGQGGFGSVYKGELPNGILVAVKIIERSNTDGKDFINEVSTIGTIHHFNVVRLLGFCSERDRRALVYEFMPNGSLDKFISTKLVNNTDDPFKGEILSKIVRGTASGIKYLHEGCNLRILHFDIKPHNILLDHNLNPKVSDFGLAKICSKDRTDITVTAAKGTVGYMAPEVYSRNFGNVSYKSDVYSFGMMILKMVVGERSLEPDLETGPSDVYYPELIYENLVKKEDIEYAIEISKTDEEIVKRLIIVAFWCIQWNPAMRPSMTRVVQMLDCDLESLEIPPRPFLS